MKARWLLLVLCLGLTPGLARADVKTHALCSEGMVLQQQANVKVWGTADKWTDAEPKTVNGFSACAYFFGRALQEKLKVPVGLIHTSVGGTRIETWMSPAALESAGIKESTPEKPNQNSVSALYNGMI